MTWLPKTTQRMEQRVGQLIDSFESCCDEFDEANLFTGPSVYFHSKTIRMLREKSPGDAVLDESFLESLYATLTAWGMHRMGPGNTKLVEFKLFVDGFRQLEKAIRKLSAFKIVDLSPGEIGQVSEQVWDIISELKTGQGETKIVAGSKALHHVLPELVPPIDRQYTIRFFFHHKNLNQGDQPAFQEMFPYFCRIAAESREKIERRIGRGMNTSTTKVIDNAIVGFVRTNLTSSTDA